MTVRYAQDVDLSSVFPTIPALYGGLSPSSHFGLMKAFDSLLIAAGNPLGANAADATDDVLYGMALDGGALNAAGNLIEVYAAGMGAATAQNKRFKLFLNPTMTGQTVSAAGIITGGHVTAGTALADSGAWVAANSNNVGWSLSALIMKYGAAGSNTQIGQAAVIAGASHLGMQAAQALTLVESATINIVVTGSSYTSSAASDVLLQQLVIQGSCQ
jgi:hypothetical protein